MHSMDGLAGVKAALEEKRGKIYGASHKCTRLAFSEAGEQADRQTCPVRGRERMYLCVAVHMHLRFADKWEASLFDGRLVCSCR